jgi:hypothetical protein
MEPDTITSIFFTLLDMINLTVSDTIQPFLYTRVATVHLYSGTVVYNFLVRNHAGYPAGKSRGDARVRIDSVHKKIVPAAVYLVFPLPMFDLKELVEHIIIFEKINKTTQNVL